MNICELRKAPGYLEAHAKVENYSKGFRFTVNYASIPVAKANALKILLADCCKENLIQSVAIDLDLTGTQTAETFIRV